MLAGGSVRAMDQELANRKLLFGSISMQTGLSIGGVHHAEEEQEGAGARKALCEFRHFLRWALLMRAIK